MTGLIEKVMDAVRYPFVHWTHPDVMHIDIPPLPAPPAPAVPAISSVESPKFAVAINRVLKNEGGFSDDPRDPGNWTGGKVNVGVLKGTNRGISAASYPDLDIKNLSDDQIIAIFYRDFWIMVGADSMPSAVAYQALDFAVNAGPQTAIKKLQTAVGVAPDGEFGPASQAAVKALAPGKVVKLLLAERLDYHASLATWPTFGKGWAKRVATDLRYGALDS